MSAKISIRLSSRNHNEMESARKCFFEELGYRYETGFWYRNDSKDSNLKEKEKDSHID